MVTPMAWQNPQSWWGRFAMHYVLGFTAGAVAGIVGWLAFDKDPLVIGWLAITVGLVFGLLRGTMAQPGTPFWGSPVS